MQSQLGFSHFIQQIDSVGLGIFVLMVLMSISTWYLIIWKGIFYIRTEYVIRQFSAKSRQKVDLHSALKHLNSRSHLNPMTRSLQHMLSVLERSSHQGKGEKNSDQKEEARISRAFQQILEQERLSLESGLTWMATVASSAPFIGLFGTVWGIYHALLAIASTGQSTLDKVAGPVGEALIMTAIGLAVAIPAAIAYNTFTRWNRRTLSRLDTLAIDLLDFRSMRPRNTILGSQAEPADGIKQFGEEK